MVRGTEREILVEVATFTFSQIHLGKVWIQPSYGLNGSGNWTL